ncbi:uncharacterized protein VICG_01829 [Vittaforma corneae ATCC 50505]|uniref:Uncharacterized protein n=1 Tax=Vittaforma corneae (strain ATCC 50505) TaxID=993615 RepID=L2GKX6_VITCO|nr:uncharacterized protein VICG_01829 [Vittaforma corneae ATCC 50505]ELA41130.1 hypothetical protein VICG_01829 [Vittaforma corneae ATCC 50505]
MKMRTLMKQQIFKSICYIFTIFNTRIRTSASCNISEQDDTIEHSHPQDGRLIMEQSNEALDMTQSSIIERKRPNPSTADTSGVNNKYGRYERSDESDSTSSHEDQLVISEDLYEILGFVENNNSELSVPSALTNNLHSQEVSIADMLVSSDHVQACSKLRSDAVTKLTGQIICDVSEEYQNTRTVDVSPTPLARYQYPSAYSFYSPSPQYYNAQGLSGTIPYARSLAYIPTQAGEDQIAESADPGDESVEIALLSDQNMPIEDKFKSAFYSIRSVSNLSSENEEINIENYIKLCKDTIFTDEDFLKAYESAACYKGRCLFGFIFKKYLAIKRRRIALLETALKIWAWLSRLLILRSNGIEKREFKEIPEELLFPYFCLGLIYTYREATTFKYLYYMLDKSIPREPQPGVIDLSVTSLSEDQIFCKKGYIDTLKECIYFRNYQKININDLNILDTISNAIRILASKEPARIIFDNLKEIFDNDKEMHTYRSRSRCRMIYFMCIYRATCSSRFLNTVRIIMSNASEAVPEDAKAVQIRLYIENELREYYAWVHRNICSMFREVIIPYLNEVTVRGKGMQKTAWQSLHQRKRNTSSYTNEFLSSLFISIDGANVPNTEEIKFRIYTCAYTLASTYHTICDLGFILLGNKPIKMGNHLTTNKVFEYIAISQFDPRRIKILLEEYKKHYEGIKASTALTSN